MASLHSALYEEHCVAMLSWEEPWEGTHSSGRVTHCSFLTPSCQPISTDSGIQEGGPSTVAPPPFLSTVSLSMCLLLGWEKQGLRSAPDMDPRSG